jgi:hypothetical protein
MAGYSASGLGISWSLRIIVTEPWRRGESCRAHQSPSSPYIRKFPSTDFLNQLRVVWSSLETKVLAEVVRMHRTIAACRQSHLSWGF